MTASREFLDHEGDGPSAAISSGGEGQDYALVVGVNDYPELRSLRGAIADARAFADWLVDADGGGLSKENVHSVLSSPEPLAPIGHEINAALEDLLLRAGKTGGRRFYFYFSGHGCVGDRASDLALCMANWSELRRRSALSSEAWLDEVVRSGAFDEVAFFLDCCRVWATRAVGLPPVIAFANPVERARGTRVFVAYATEFQRPALEVDERSAAGQLEVRGIFTRVLIDGLSGAAAGAGGVVTAASLKQYIEAATPARAAERWFHQHAEVRDGFDAKARFGRSIRPPWDKRHDDPRAPGPSELDTVRIKMHRHRELRVPDLRETRAPASTVPITYVDADVARSTSRLSIIISGLAYEHPGANIHSIHAPAPWSIRGNGVTIALDTRNTLRAGDCLVFSAPLEPGLYTLRYTGRREREVAIQLYPHWSTYVVINQERHIPHFETIGLFLLPREGQTLWPEPRVADAIYRGLATLVSAPVDVPHELRQAMDDGVFNDPMLGLLAAHLLARGEKPDPARVDSIANQLESMLGPCPDVDALRLRAALIRGSDLPWVPSTDPPMLREGLLAFVEASHRMPDLIPPGSALEYACVERLVDSPLSSWPVSPAKSATADDWLMLSIEELAAQKGGGTERLDATTIARELGVPTRAVTTRIETTRERSRRAGSAVSFAVPGHTSALETVPLETKRPALVLEAGAPSIPGYQLERVIGEGGMGRVYLAKREETDERVAVKIMRPQAAGTKEARRRFLREIDTMARLRHDRIIPLLGHGEAKRCFYFVMPYHERGNLANLVRREGQPELGAALRIIDGVLEGLTHAHHLGYVHRDIKPQNILLDHRGAAVIADFGLAKGFEEAGLWDITKSGASAGTAVYMPREQVVNFKRVRPSADVWAVAAVLYWLLSGATPRDIPLGRGSFLSVLRDPIIPIRQRTQALPSALCDLLDRALSNEPGARPADAGAFRGLLRDVMGPFQTR